MKNSNKYNSFKLGKRRVFLGTEDFALNTRCECSFTSLFAITVASVALHKYLYADLEFLYADLEGLYADLEKSYAALEGFKRNVKFQVGTTFKLGKGTTFKFKNLLHSCITVDCCARAASESGERRLRVHREQRTNRFVSEVYQNCICFV